MQLSGFCAGDPANDIGHTKSVTCTDGTQLTLTLTHTGANNAPTNRREVRVIGNDYEKSSGNLRDCACNAYSGKIKGTQYNPAFTSILYFDFHDYNSCTALDQPVGSSYRNQNRLAYSIARALPTPSPTETPTAAPTRDIHSGFCSAFTILRKGKVNIIACTNCTGARPCTDALNHGAACIQVARACTRTHSRTTAHT